MHDKALLVLRGVFHFSHPRLVLKCGTIGVHYALSICRLGTLLFHDGQILQKRVVLEKSQTFNLEYVLIAEKNQYLLYQFA